MLHFPSVGGEPAAASLEPLGLNAPGPQKNGPCLFPFRWPLSLPSERGIQMLTHRGHGAYTTWRLLLGPAKHEEGSVMHHLGIGLGIRRVQDMPQNSSLAPRDSHSPLGSFFLGLASPGLPPWVLVLEQIMFMKAAYCLLNGWYSANSNCEG